MARSPRALPQLLTIAVVLAVVIGVPIAEFSLLALVAQWIGIWPTLGILFAKMVIGTFLARRELSRARETLTEALRAGRQPTPNREKRGMGDSALVLIGAILLILPGLVTDLVGLVMVLPFTRALPRAIGAALFSRQAKRFGIDTTRMAARMDPGSTIKGETVDETPADPGRRPGDDGQVISGEIER